MARTSTARVDLTEEEYAAQGTDNTPTQRGPVTAGQVRQKWDASQRATAKERRDYWINSAMVAGEQWLQWSDRSDTLQEMPRDDDRVRVSVNRLWPTTRTIIAKLLRRPLIFEVPPSAADDASSSGARIGTAILADIHSRHMWEELRRVQSYATWKGGTSIVCTEWDPKAGVPIGDTETGDRFGTGDTIESVLDISMAATEPGCRNLELAQWWIKAVALPPEQVQSMYGLPAVPPADATVLLSPLQRRLAGTDRGEANVPLTLVLTYFERPSDLFPQGQVATVVGGRIVDPHDGRPGPWPFPFTDRLNAVVIRETPIDGRWTGDTVLSAAVPVQVALNQSYSSIVEHMKMAGNARLAVPAGSGDEWSDLSDMPSEIVEFIGPTPPSWLSPPQMPAWWVDQPKMLEQAIDDILGVHDVSRGETPANVNSGIGLTILSEQDDTPLGLMAKEAAEGWGRLASLVLAIYADKVKETRSAKVERSGSAPEVVQWTGRRLAGQTTATVPLDAVAPRSRAGQMQLAIQLKQEFPDLDIKTFARIADLPDAQDLVEAVDMDVVKARRENGEMAAGNICVPADFDDHAKHINEHNTFRKTSRYEALDEDTQHIFEAHIKGHEVDAAREMGQQLAKAQVSPALAGAAQAHEPALAGDHAALLAGMPGSATSPIPTVPGSGSGSGSGDVPQDQQGVTSGETGPPAADAATIPGGQ